MSSVARIFHEQDSSSKQRAHAKIENTSTLARVVLCVEPNYERLYSLQRLLMSSDIVPLGALNSEQVHEILNTQTINAIVVDLQNSQSIAFKIISNLRASGNRLPILVLTNEGAVENAVHALKLGATDFLQSPITAERLQTLVLELMQSSASFLAAHETNEPSIETTSPIIESSLYVSIPKEDSWFEGMFGLSVPMRHVFDAIERVAKTEAPVLIVGESGSGKELVARAIHARSLRRQGAFVPVHTGAIPKELVASELFGHERGSFTGALTAADGKFTAAARGSIFLDEVGTMSSDVQIALLRVLETMSFTRVGGRKEQIADVRIIAATNRDLLTLVQENKFREDLYFRLNVFLIVLPPLRERHEDILPLAQHYLSRFSQQYGTSVRCIHSTAAERLLNYPWPGNVRELRNVMERAAVFCTNRELLASDLQLVTERLPEPGQVVRESSRIPVAQPIPRHEHSYESTSVSMPISTHEHVAGSIPNNYLTPMGGMPVAHTSYQPSITIPVGTTIQDAEKVLILQTLEHMRGNKQKAARVLGISRRCLYNRLEEYGLVKSSSELSHEIDGDEPSGSEIEV